MLCFRERQQDDLAYEAEISRSYLSQLEKGAFYASLRQPARARMRAK
jgi:DNA-binding XRE family transcriptional regulator